MDPIDDVYSSGGYFRTKGWQIDAAKLAAADDAKAKVNVGLTISGGRTLPTKGGEPVVYAPDKRIAVFKLTRSDDQWLVSFIGFLS